MVTELGKVAYQWPADTDFALWELDVLDRNCPVCGRMMQSAITAIAASIPWTGRCS